MLQQTLTTTAATPATPGAPAAPATPAKPAAPASPATPAAPAVPSPAPTTTNASAPPTKDDKKDDKKNDKSLATNRFFALSKDKNTLIDWIASAKTSVDIASFAIDDDAVMKAIIDLRTKGVTVRLFLQRPGLYNGKYSAVEGEKSIITFSESVNTKVNHMLDPELPDAVHSIQMSSYIIVDDTSVVVLNAPLTQKMMSQGQSVGVMFQDKRLMENIKSIFDADFEQTHKKANDRARFYFDANMMILGPIKTIETLMEFVRKAENTISIVGNAIDNYDFVIFLQRQAKDGKRIKILTNPDNVNILAAEYLKRFPNIDIHTSKDVSGEGLFIVLDRGDDKSKTFVGSITLDEIPLNMARSLGIGTADKDTNQTASTFFDELWNKSEKFNAARIVVSTSPAGLPGLSGMAGLSIAPTQNPSTPPVSAANSAGTTPPAMPTAPNPPAVPKS